MKKNFCIWGIGEVPKNLIREIDKTDTVFICKYYTKEDFEWSLKINIEDEVLNDISRNATIEYDSEDNILKNRSKVLFDKL